MEADDLLMRNREYERRAKETNRCGLKKKRSIAAHYDAEKEDARASTFKRTEDLPKRMQEGCYITCVRSLAPILYDQRCE